MIVGGWLYFQVQLYLKSGSDDQSENKEKKNLVSVSPRTINYVLGVVVVTLTSELTDLLTRCGIVSLQWVVGSNRRSDCWHKLEAILAGLLTHINFKGTKMKMLSWNSLVVSDWQTGFKKMLSRWRGPSRVLRSSPNVPPCLSLWLIDQESDSKRIKSTNYF